MDVIKELGITEEIKNKIHTEIFNDYMDDCISFNEIFCDRYNAYDIKLKQDHLEILIMNCFVDYMNACDFDWMPVSLIDFRRNVSFVKEHIEKTIIDKSYNYVNIVIG